MNKLFSGRATEEFTVNDDLEFVRVRDGLIPGSADYDVYVGTFIESRLPILERCTANIAKGFEGGDIGDFAELALSTHYRCSRKFRGNSSYKTFLYRALMNEFINFAKTSSKRNSIERSIEEHYHEIDGDGKTKDISDAFAIEGMDADRELLEKRLDVLELCLSDGHVDLNNFQRNIFKLKLEGLSDRDISLRLGRLESTIRTSYFYALKKVRPKFFKMIRENGLLN